MSKYYLYLSTEEILGGPKGKETAGAQANFSGKNEHSGGAFLIVGR